MTIAINNKNLENQLIELSKTFHKNINDLVLEFLSQKVNELKTEKIDIKMCKDTLKKIENNQLEEFEEITDIDEYIKKLKNEITQK